MSMGPPSPSKGKGIDTGSKTWRAGWWDFYPLLERPKRPLQWSQSSVFVLPSPTPIITSPALYDPPSVISVAPGDQWLFAYFPRRDGGGIVAASWLASHREWAASASGIPTRLPPQGPPTPVSDPTLVLVTEDNWVHLTYIRIYATGIRSIKRTLAYSGISSETVPSVDVGENPNNTRQCIDAAIGIGYNETSIFIATHSRRMPPPSRPALAVPSFNSMELSLPVDLTNSSPPDQKTIEWENWGEERTIELFEVQLRFDGVSMALAVSAIPSLECTAPLTSLVFLCGPPPQSSQPPSDSASPSKHNPAEKGKMYLATSSIDFHDYVKPPTSTISLYSLMSRPASANNPRVLFWALHKDATRTLETGVVTHIESKITRNKDAHRDYQGLNDVGFRSTSWQPTPIMCMVDSAGRDLPLTATVSPNGRLLCTISSSLLRWETTIHLLPKAHISDASSPSTSLALAIAILGRVSTADLVHSICSSNLSLSEATNIIYHALDILDRHYNSDIPYPSTWDVVGVATEVYRQEARSFLTTDEKKAGNLQDRWQTARDICSLAACNIAFEDCKEDDGYDLEAVWQIISMCTWVVSFAVKLMKACVLSSNAVLDEKEGGQADSEGLALPILLHLAHPFALQNLIAALQHVKAFRTYVGSLPAGGENAKIAQFVLVDTVDSSGVDFGGLISLLEENFDSTQKIESEECRKALAACQPTPVMRPRLRQLLQKISNSESILNKSTLFVNLSISSMGLLVSLLGLSGRVTKETSSPKVCSENKGRPVFVCVVGGKLQ
ncbi:hypothetical protein BDZ97DRAFT_1918412 [Flammula alnicola]|nr:hypothetical protein BDZ97DRAFT_1918412 [Flammula alnicola]